MKSDDLIIHGDDEPDLPADFRKISIEADPKFRPLSAEDLNGLSEDDWKEIEGSEAVTESPKNSVSGSATERVGGYREASKTHEPSVRSGAVSASDNKPILAETVRH